MLRMAFRDSREGEAPAEPVGRAQLGEAFRFRFVEDHFDRDTWVLSPSFS